MMMRLPENSTTAAADVTIESNWVSSPMDCALIQNYFARN